MRYFVTILFFFSNLLNAQSNDFIKGADISFVPIIEDLGGEYTVGGTQTDPIEIFTQNGVDYFRLRLWHTPTDGYCGLQKTILMAARIKQNGSKFLLDIHYSDTWADPAHQTKPLAWQSLAFANLIDSIYAYTLNVVQTFSNANLLPDMIQIGNEITVGFLWPEGRVGGTYNTTTQWQQFTTLLKAARNAIVDAVPGTTIPIMLHIDRGGDNAGARWFFDKMNSYQVNYDYIGLSFYPWWHGTLTQLTQNLNDLATRYGKNLIVVETAYPWTLQAFDNVTNIVGSTSQLHSGYSATVDGQFNFLFDIIQIIKNVPSNKGKGLFYWAPEYISVQPIGSPWENLTLFNFQGEVLNSIAAFHNPDTSGSICVTLKLNTSTNWDTLKTNGIVQLRGEVANGSNVLPSGENLTWDQNSQVVLQNDGGDYWTKTIRVLPGTEIHYKYWTGHSISDPTFLRLGWEGPIQPYDLTSGNYRKFIAGDADTILNVEYFNSSGVTVNQSWQPFAHKEDSIAVYFRVNLGGITSTGRFSPSVNGPVGVRGSAVNTLNILSWENTNLVLTRENSSVDNGSFWSGVIYYPLSASNQTQEYKFFIENDSQNGWENNVQNRSFVIPNSDTTINWVYFDNQHVVTGIDNELNPVNSFKLFQNYPNPFNPDTKIIWQTSVSSWQTIKVYDVLGNELITLLDEFKSSGSYEINFSGSNLSSGMYLIKLTTKLGSKSIKAILLK